MSSDITNEKKNTPQYLAPYLKILKYDAYPLQVLGSASLKSIHYPSDIDLFTQVKKSGTIEHIHEHFMKMREEIEKRDDVYFVEAKVQNINGDKIKKHHLKDLNEAFFLTNFKSEKIDFLKLDFVIYVNSEFMELSVIYSFNTTQGKKELTSSLYKDMRELRNDKSYYKFLKRFYSWCKLQTKLKNKQSILNDLTAFFNSDVGKLYKEVNILKAIDLVKQYHNNPLVRKRVEVVETNLKLKQPINKTISKLDSEINDEALLFIKKNHPQLLENLPF